jgi:hypothetical protein
VTESLFLTHFPFVLTQIKVFGLLLTEVKKKTVSAHKNKKSLQRPKICRTFASSNRKKAG